MNIRNNKWIAASLLTAVAAAVTTGCKDDHFDVNSDVTGTKTIWQNIQDDPTLSEYADILQRVQYSQNEDKMTRQTYAELLNGDQTFTIWAPKNGTFNYSQYSRMLNENGIEGMKAVEKELIRNNMARYTYLLNGVDSVKLDLFNDKTAWLNYNTGTFQGVKISTPNVSSSNGVLHVLDHVTNFVPNVYEYLASDPELSKINEFIKSFQKSEFSEAQSTQGPTVNGQVTWVDSITHLTNTYTKMYLNAYLNSEDSNYVMILPNNDAWDTMLAKTKKYYTFKENYEQTIYTQTEAGVDTSYVKPTNMSVEEIDSLTDLYAKNAICQDLVFNANWQYEQVPITSIKDIKRLDAMGDSLRSTAGTKFKHTGTLNQTNKSNVVEVDNFAEMFGNADPVRLSNGYVYKVNDWKLPTTVYFPTIDRSADLAYGSSDAQCTAISKGKPYIDQKVVIEDPEGIEEPQVIELDTVYKYDFIEMKAKTTTSHPGAYFRLQNVLSGTYDIAVVINYNTEDEKPNKFRAYLYDDKMDHRVTKDTEATLKNPDAREDAVGESIQGSNFFVNSKPYVTKKDGKYNIEYTDTVYIARDYKFEVSYYGLQNAYPTLYIKSNFKSGEKDTYSRNIWVNAIILKPKE